MAIRVALILATLAPSLTFAAGLASNDNFVVYTPDQQTPEQEHKYAELVVERAQAFRDEVAKKWLGEKLPNGAGESVIYVDFSDNEDRGLTWAKDHPDRLFHNVYLTTSPESAIGSTLHHEIAHTVLATRYPFPNRLPEWVEEGIATRYDDAARQAERERIVAHWLRTGTIPNLVELFEAKDVKSHDQNSYAAAASLVSFLLTRGDERTVVQFADSGRSRGWSAALQSHYDIESVGELQALWREWLFNNSTGG